MPEVEGDPTRTGTKAHVRPSLAVILPLPPTVNNLYATVNRRRVLSREGRRFKERVARALGPGNPYAPSPDTAAVLRESLLSLFIDFYFESPLRRDLDGGLKIAQDAICEALGINDNRVVDIHLVKRIDPLHPRIEVLVEAIPPDEWQYDREYLFQAG